ncbi:Glutamate receptor-like 25, partial [Homarus americanus]
TLTPLNPRCNVYLHLPYNPQGAQALRIASWTPHRGLTLTTHYSLFPDKFDKFPQKPTLKAATEVNPINKMITLDNDEALEGERFKFTGPAPELIDYLARAMNFSYQYLRPADGTWGVKLENGSWSGMVGMLMRQEVNIGVGPFIISGSRAEAMDFTVPIFLDYWRILGARGQPEVDPWGFILPLAPLVWLAILSALLLLPATVFLMSSYFFHKRENQKNLLRVIFDYIRVLLQQDVLDPVNCWWESLVLAVWMLMMLVLTRSYAGNLMSLLAVRHISEPYQTLQDLLDDPMVTMIWEKDSQSVRYLHSVESGIYREISDTEKEGRLIYKTHEEFPETIDTLVRQGDHVLMEVDMGKCSFYESREGFLSLMFALVGPKASPIVPALSKRITAMTEAGLFFYWMKSAEPNSTVCYRSPTKITVKTTLNLTNVWGMFVILAVGHIISLCVLFYELLGLRLQHRVGPVVEIFQ